MFSLWYLQISVTQFCWFIHIPLPQTLKLYWIHMHRVHISDAQNAHLSAVLKSSGGTVLSGMLFLAVILEVDDTQEHVGIF